MIKKLIVFLFAITVLQGCNRALENTKSIIELGSIGPIPLLLVSCEKTLTSEHKKEILDRIEKEL